VVPLSLPVARGPPGRARGREPWAVAEGHRRAAVWFDAAGDLDAAVGHAFEADDLELAAVLVGRAMNRYHWSGPARDTRAWLARFSDDDLLERPWLAVLAAWETMSSGDPAITDRYADLAERGSFEGRPPMARRPSNPGAPSFRLHGTRRRRRRPAERRASRRARTRGSPWRGMALWMLAIARLMQADPDGADEALAEAVVAVRAASSPALSYCLLGHRALLASTGTTGPPPARSSRGERARGCRARRWLPLVCRHPHRGDPPRDPSGRGERGSPAARARGEPASHPVLERTGSGGPVPRRSRARAPGARGRFGASTLLSQASGVIRRRPGLGALPAEVAALRATIRTTRPAPVRRR